MILVVYNRPKMEKLFEYTRHFWPITITSKLVQKDLKAIEQNAKYLQNYFIYFISIATIPVVGCALWEWKLLVGVWTWNEKKELLNFFIFQQAAFFPIMVAVIVGYDTLFVALSAEIMIQFKILCYCLEHLTVSKAQDDKQTEFIRKLAFYVKYHNFLLR